MGLPERRPQGQIRYTQDVIEAVLWETAMTGGNVAQALRNLQDHAFDNDMVLELPRVEQARRWVRHLYRNRYHEIVAEKEAEVDAQLKTMHLERAMQADELEQAAMRRVAAGIDDLDALAASQALKNLSMTKKIALEGALAIDRKGTRTEDSRALRVIGDALVRLGVATVTTVDGEAIEVEGEGTPPS